jgi:HlyD family secretion protein
MDTPLPPSTLARRRRLTLLGAALVLLALCASAWAINRVLRPSISAADIRIAEVRRGDIANTINAAGVVIPMHEELITSPIQSRVAKVHAKLGQSVAAGALLLELDDRSIILARDSLKEQLAQQENRVEGLSLELEQKRKQIASAIELLELDLQSARVKFERYTTLRKAGGVSGEDMLTAELNVKRLDVQLRQQRELIVDSRRATNSSIEGARLQQRILHKQLDEQHELLSRTRVRAPFAGVLTMLVEDEGASLANGQQVARVSEPNNYRVEASLSDFHSRSLEPGQLVRVEQGKEVLAGRVQTVLPEIQNGVVKLLITLDRPDHPLLRNKMRVDVNIVTDHRRGVLLAASGPAFNGKGKQAVWVVAHGVARKTELDIGAGDGSAVEILSGARAGDQLVVSDPATFKEHDTITINQTKP